MDHSFFTLWNYSIHAPNENRDKRTLKINVVMNAIFSVFVVIITLMCKILNIRVWEMALLSMYISDLLFIVNKC